MSEPYPQRRTVRLGGVPRAALAALITSLGCARFGYDIPDGTSAGAGPGGSGGASADAGSAGSGGAGNAGAGGAGAGGASAGAGGAAGAAGAENTGGAGAGGAAGSGGPDASAPSCSDRVRNRDEVGIDCGGATCAPCACALAEPERLGAPNYPGNDLWAPSLSADGLTLYFGLTVPGVAEQVALSTRPDRSSSFGPGYPVTSPISQTVEGTPHIAASGLALYFFSERGGGAGDRDRDLYVATRSQQTDDFGNVRALSELNSASREHLPWLSADELTIYFVSNRTGVNDIFRAARASRNDPFSNIEAVTELNSDSEDGGITLSPDGLEAIFSSSRPGGVGQRDLYRATRSSTSDAFTNIELIPGIDTGNNEFDPSLSPDGSELYFTSNRDGEDNSIYRAGRSCGL